MPKLDLTRARAIRGSFGNASAIKGAGFSWAAPVADPLAQYYGVGPGQITFDMPLHDSARMTLDGSNYVSAVQHAGGAGAYFNASASGSARPRYSAAEGGLIFDGNDDLLTFANAADLIGVHCLIPVKLLSWVAYGQFGGSTSSELTVGENPAGGTVSFSCGGGSGSILLNHRSPSVPYTMGQWCLVEIRATSTTTALAVNKTAKLGTGNSTTPYLFGRLGYGSMLSRASNFVVGRSVGVICAEGATWASPEPAVLAARQWLAQKYGVTLQ